MPEARGPDSASWLACLQRELEAREATVKSEGGPWGEGTVVRAGEAAYTTGDWWLGSWKRGGPRKARTSKDGTCGAGLEKRGGRTCGAWKSMGLEKQLDCEPGKAEVREGEGLTTTVNMMRAGDWRQGTGGKSGRKQEQETAGGGAGDSGSPMAAESYFSSQSKNCGVRSGGNLLAGLNYALVDSLEFGGATHKSV